MKDILPGDMVHVEAPFDTFKAPDPGTGWHWGLRMSTDICHANGFMCLTYRHCTISLWVRSSEDRCEWNSWSTDPIPTLAGSASQKVSSLRMMDKLRESAGPLRAVWNWSLDSPRATPPLSCPRGSWCHLNVLSAHVVWVCIKMHGESLNHS